MTNFSNDLENCHFYIKINLKKRNVLLAVTHIIIINSTMEFAKQIDHIVEVKHGGTNDLSNLQALCPCCHAVKTRRCAQQSWEFTSPEIDSGRANMIIDAPAKKRQRPTSSA